MGILTLCFLDSRLFGLLPCRRYLCLPDDLPCRTIIWEEESSNLHLDLLHRWLRLRHVRKGFRNCLETQPRRAQPVQSCVDICFPHRHGFLHSHTDELFQQGLERVLDLDVGSPAQNKIDLANRLHSVNPLYYVTFTTATLCASFILFKGFNTTDAVNTISLLCGFLIIFSGVYLLNISRHDPDGQLLNSKFDEEGVPTDGIAGFQTRRSMQARRSHEPHRRSSSSVAFLNGHGDREGLIHSYDVENQNIGLSELTEESDGEPGPTYKGQEVDHTSQQRKKHDDQ